MSTITRRTDGRWCKKFCGRMYYLPARLTESEALSQWKAKRDELTTAEARLVTMRRLSQIQPSPENLDIYQPVTPESVKDLAVEIKKDGVLEPLVVTLDGDIISGHRRFAAAKLAGLTEVPVRVHPIRREDDPDEFLRLLIAHNTQRVKTFAEKLHEEAAKIDPAQAYRRLVAQRAELAEVKVKPMVLGERRKRSKISAAKKLMLDAVLEILRTHKKPISDRGIHYPLLNNPPLKNANKPSSRYRNDRASYNNLCGLITRARIEGIIPWDWISDETRPVTTWDVWKDTQGFLRRQLGQFLYGYYRDLLQSQPNHIEILAEKNTVASVINDVAGKYCIPLTSGRGYCSSLPRYKMAERYRKSGKSKLVLLIISDLDPAGMGIAESFAQSLRDDFAVENIHAIKVGITFEQVNQFKIPHGEKAKEGRGKKDGLRREFVRRYGEYVYEVEALPSGELENLLDNAVRSVLDLDAFNYEVEQEHVDARQIEATRAAARSMFKDLDLDDEEEVADE